MATMSSEAHLQAAVARLLDYTGALWCHVPNSRKTASRAIGGWWSGQGVKSGVPDVLVFEPRGANCGLALELKNGPRGKLSNAQKKWLDDLEKRGWMAVVVYSFEEAQKTIELYLNKKRF